MGKLFTAVSAAEKAESARVVALLAEYFDQRTSPDPLKRVKRGKNRWGPQKMVEDMKGLGIEKVLTSDAYLSAMRHRTAVSPDMLAQLNAYFTLRGETEWSNRLQGKEF